MSSFYSTQTFSSFSVDDIDAARAFYGETLGMVVSTNPMGFLDIHLPQGGSIFVYAKPDHTPASFTILNFSVPDVEAAVDDLNARGVVTKIYTDPDLDTDEKGIARSGPDGGPSIAWFMDPAGNVLAVMEAMG
ncbi:VOC family protein [Microbacterium sp. H1-D42]|uniref:VOC family protein n=1 Tax=Microbacterium sp. H1-D42 TaxID=2925844 RepID=UPI001F53A6FB|nr:VOC family protein [Microbacterium sp. H1-D42]UNK72060.1 VOC family protein [Microbacterium sp. H1-D42]